MNYLFQVLVFIFGASMGSFLNVISLRYNTGLSFVKGKSRCLNCNKEIGGDNLFPIFSYVYLGGRCAFCKSRLPLAYLLVEIFSGIGTMVLYFKFGFSFEFFISSIIYYLLSIIFIYDLRHKIIPDPFVFLFIFFSFLYSFLYSSFHLSLPDSTVQAGIFPSLLGALLVPLPFFLIWFFSGGKFLGFGDVKFMVGMGLLFGVSQGFVAVFLSFWIGAAFILLLFLYRNIVKLLANKSYNISTRGAGLSWKSEIPFAPFLCLGTAVEFFFQIRLW